MASLYIIVASVVLLFGSSLAAPTDCPNGQLAKVGETILFRWTIHNFSIRAERDNDNISSPLFPIDADSSPPKWVVRLTPGSCHVSLYLCLDSNQKDVHLADYHFRVLANNYSTTGNVRSVTSETPKKFPDEGSFCWGRSEVLPRSSLANYLWDNVTLNILCDIQVRNESECAGAPDGFFDQNVRNPFAYTDWCDTEYKTVEVLSSTWEILDVPQKFDENKTTVSPRIKGTEAPLVEWETEFLMRIVKHESGESERYAGLYVCLKSSKQEGEVLAKVRITVSANDTKNNRVFSNSDWVVRYSLEEHNPSIVAACWGRERVFSNSKIEGLLREDSFTVTTEVTRIREVTSCSKDLPSITQTCPAIPKEEDTDTLIVNKISNLVPTEFLNPTGAEPFPPNVLFLYATINNTHNGDEEIEDDKVSINATGSYAFRGDTNPDSVGIVSDLLVLAYKNHLDDLKKVCEEILSDKITVENTIRILQAADETNSTELKEKAFQFLLANRDQVLDTKDFENLPDSEHPPLITQISWRTLLELHQP